MKRTTFLFVLALCFLLGSAPARALELDRVRVAVIQGDAGTPVEEESVHLHLYRYDSPSSTQIHVTDLDAGSCATGTDGRCEIWLLPGMPKDDSGFYHGALEVRGMLRSILWPGGSLEIILNLDHLQLLEFGDDTPSLETLTIESQAAVNWPGVAGVVVIMGLVVVLVWRKARKQALMGLLLGLLLCLALAAATPVQAASVHEDPNYCSGGGGVDMDLTRCYSTSELLEYLVRWGVTEVGTGAAHSFDEAIWLLDRLMAGLFDLVINTPILAEITNAFLKIANTLMPSILRQIVMGDTGLFYIAIALSGVLMTIPLWSGNSKLVRPEHAILWGVVLAALFISGSAGYDLVTGIETLRSGMVKQVMSGEVQASEVVTGPMQAPDVAISADTSWKLPTAFEKQYFPAPVRQVVTIYLFETGFPIPNATAGNTEVETNVSMLHRQLVAGQSLIWSVLSLMGAIMLLLAAVTFAFLAMAAMMLILFLFAALPLGFFEFGNSILSAIIGKYMNVVMLSLAMAIFMRWVTAGINLIGGSSDIPGALRYLVIVIMMIYALSIISGSAFRLLTESGQVFGQSMQAVLGQGPNVLGGLGGALTGGITGALLGGPAGAVAGALGGGLSHGGGGEGGSSSASAITSGMLSVAGLRAVGRMLPKGHAIPPARGDVFRRGSDAQGVGKQESVNQEDQKHLSSPAEAEATLQTLASREGWQPEQVEMIKAAARRNAGAGSLSAAPGFERSTPETLQRALNAAQVLAAETGKEPE